MQRNPFQNIEDMFERMGHDIERARVSLGGEIATAPLDVAEWDGEFIVMADLPGYEEEDIDVRVTDNTLHINAEHKAEHEPEPEQFLRRERARGTASRSVSLPEDIDREGVSATYENGVLTVTLPKAHAEEEEAGHRIEIE